MITSQVKYPTVSKSTLEQLCVRKYRQNEPRDKEVRIYVSFIFACFTHARTHTHTQRLKYTYIYFIYKKATLTLHARRFLPLCWLSVRSKRCNIYYVMHLHQSHSQWPRGPGHELFPPAITMGSWVRIQLEAWMSVCLFRVCGLLCIFSVLEPG
jgi:hypothetical protein